MTMFARRLVSITRNRSFILRRTYRGKAGPAVTDKTDSELLRIAEPKAAELWKNHTRLPTIQNIPTASLDNKSSEGKEAVDVELDLRRKRLIYRSKQRGWLEVDLLLGTWASQHVPIMKDPTELDEYEALCNRDTMDLYNLVTLKVLEEDESSLGFRIQEWARHHPLGKAEPSVYEKIKKDAKLI